MNTQKKILLQISDTNFFITSEKLLVKDQLKSNQNYHMAFSQNKISYMPESQPKYVFNATRINTLSKIL